MSDQNAPIPTGMLPPPFRGPAFWPSYYDGRVQYPVLDKPMQTAMSRELWAGAQLGQWRPLQPYGAYWPAAPKLAPMQEAQYLVTQPMHNEVGYQMVAMRANGVPIGGTPATTPTYVTAGPLQPGYNGFVQPIMRIEQTPLAARVAAPPPQSNPSGHRLERLGPRPAPQPRQQGAQGPWQWNVQRGATGLGPNGGGPEAWPFVRPPNGYMMAGTNAGGWPVFALQPVAPPDLPVEVPHELARASTNPSSNPLPGALGGVPLLATGVGAGVLAGGVTAWRGRQAPPRPEKLLIARKLSLQERDEMPARLARVTTLSPSGGTQTKEVKVMQYVPQQNPVVWPWIVGGFGALGAGAYAAWRCAPGQRMFTTDQMPGVTVTRSLTYEGCFQEQPWRAKKITQVVAPDVPAVEETRSFAEKRDAMAWLYTNEEPSATNGGAPASNPQGHGMATQFRPQAQLAVAKADEVWSQLRRQPTPQEANAAVYAVYRQAYPSGPYPIPSPSHPAARAWLKLRGAFDQRIHDLIRTSPVGLKPGQAAGRDRPIARAPRGRFGVSANPIPGSVGYLGYFHGGQGIPGSVGYNGYTPNPVATVKRVARQVRVSPQNGMAIQLGVAAAANEAAQQMKLAAASGAIRDLAGNPQSIQAQMAQEAVANQGAQDMQVAQMGAMLRARVGNPKDQFVQPSQWLRSPPMIPTDAAPLPLGMGALMAAQSRRNQQAQFRKLVAAGGAVRELAGNPFRQWIGGPRYSYGARPQWSGERAVRLTQRTLVNPTANPCCASCAAGGPCEGGRPAANPCCGGCAMGGPCEGGCPARGCTCRGGGGYHHHHHADLASNPCCGSCAVGGPCEGEKH